MAEKIFLSYRHGDSAGQAGRVGDKLLAVFGEKRLFLDVDATRAGTDFAKRLSDEVSNCAVLLALIGPHWLDLRDENNERRVDDPNDWVRIEIGTALKRDIPVIPVLLDGAKVPKAHLLPEDLRGLSTRSAIDVRHASFRSDVDRLVLELKRILSDSGPLRIWAATKETSVWTAIQAIVAWAVGSVIGFAFHFAFEMFRSALFIGTTRTGGILDLSLVTLLAAAASRWLPTAFRTNVMSVGFFVGFLSILTAGAVLEIMLDPRTYSMVSEYASGAQVFAVSYLFMTALSLWLLLRPKAPKRSE